MNLYHLRTALGSLLKDKWVNLASVLSIASGLFIVALGAVGVYNLNLLVQRLPERFVMVAYLKEDLGRAQRERLLETLRERPYSQAVRYISREQALQELRQALGEDSQELLQALGGENPLVDSVELRLRPQHVSPRRVREIAQELQALKGVESVQYAQRFLSSVQAVLVGARTVGALALGALLVGVVFVCWSTVKILFYRKLEEVETLRLLGATSWFIRGPFLVEGAIIGLAGGLLATGAAWGFMEFFHSATQGMPFLQEVLLPLQALYAVPLLGLLVGLSGALIALGRIKG